LRNLIESGILQYSDNSLGGNYGYGKKENDEASNKKIEYKRAISFDATDTTNNLLVDT
jgi:hypothetical protein